MKKKLTILTSMIILALSLCACGEKEEYSTFQQTKNDMASSLVIEKVIPALIDLSVDENAKVAFKEYTAEELNYVTNSFFKFDMDGFGVLTAMESFSSAQNSMGDILSIGEPEVTVDGSEIIVDVLIDGTLKDGIAEVIISNDAFTRVTSASLNPLSTTGEKMGKAALNTLLGMGTVFSVLLIIIGVIYCLSLIPILAEKLANKKKTGVDNAVAQIEKQEALSEESTDDTELVAVIAAAIAAYEGSGSTDGFVVRSIRKRF